MKYFWLTILILSTLTGCITEYVPDLNENEELLVVEGLITDQPGPNTILIYKTLPIWTKDFRTDLKGTTVWITDDLGNSDTLIRLKVGTYVTDSAKFIGVPGRIYTLHFTAMTNDGLHTYESLPTEMIPVPPIDTIYYEKRNYIYSNLPAEGCQIYLDTFDPSNACKFYRWEYEETWEIRLPFKDIVNQVCWASEKSSDIFLKNTALLNENRVIRYPIKLITNPVERLLVKYSILLTQYSLNEDEYHYWEKLQNSTEQVGGLYDIIPATITGNIFCKEDIMEKVLGYFSVSAVKSKRVFIKDHFVGRNGLFDDCMSDTMKILTSLPDTIPGIDVTFWVLYDYTDLVPPTVILTNKKYCADCTSRGINVKPVFWDDDK
jgi:hypothetical protein